MTRILLKLLTPVNISVEIDVSVMSSPPKSDILLVRRKDPKWTKVQLQRLPDGIIHPVPAGAKT